MSVEPLWITETAKLERLREEIGAGPLAIDLEADSFHHYRDKVCLAQLSFGGRDVLVDPLGGADLAVLGPVLADRGVRKLLHGADYDLRLLDRDYGLEVCGVFDTMIAARLVGERAFGLAALLEKHLGVALDKRYQRADWSRRPLPDGMVRYAVEDTQHLARLVAILEARLEELGRTGWAEEEFRRLEEVRWSTENDDREGYLRVKGTKGLTRREWTVVRELHAFRDRRARIRDVPPFRVFSDEVIVRLARERPESKETLRTVPRLPRTFQENRAADSLLEAVSRGSAAPEVAPPGSRGGRRRIPAVPTEALKALRSRRDIEAARLGIEPSLLAPRRIMEAIVERVSAGKAWRDIPELRRWQAEILGPVVPDAG